MYNDRQREWTTEQMAEATQDAIDNWNWDGDTYYPVEDQEAVDAKKEILEGYTNPEDWEGSTEDDGLIHISPQFSDVWNWLEERMESEYGAWLLVQ